MIFIAQSVLSGDRERDTEIYTHHTDNTGEESPLEGMEARHLLSVLLQLQLFQAPVFHLSAE